MFNYHLTFASPAYLALLALVPVLWWASYRRLAALGPWRRWVALLLRGLVAALVILALAEVQIVRTSDRLTVIYLLDQSLSIPADRRQAMIDYVNADIREHRQGKDRVGVVVFGRDAAIEIPPFDDNVQLDADDRERRRSRVHQPGRRDEARPGPLSRGRRQADRARERRQPEPRQRGGAGPGAGRRRAWASTCCRSATSTRAEVIVERVALPPRRPPRRAVRPPRGDHQHRRGHGEATPARSAAG